MSAEPEICFALPLLFDAVVARFKTDCTEAENDFGWREWSKHKRSEARIVWVPGDETDNAGEMRAPRNPGGNGRSLGTLGELFQCRIEAFDPKEPENERVQYEATRALYDAWYRAVYLAAYGTFEVQSLTWNTNKNERRRGAELIVVCEIEAKIPDTAYVFAPDDTAANIATSLDDVTETTVATGT